MVNFKVSSEEQCLIIRIVDRVASIAVLGVDYDPLSLRMDITAAHANGCRLDLLKLLQSDDATFGHDVFGIRRWIDRETGKIPDRKFCPRCIAH